MKENIHGSFGVRVKKDWKRNRSLYIMFIPVDFVLCAVHV